MNMLSKFSLAAFGGVTLLMLAAPADAAINRSKFNASMDDVRRYCHRIDEDFWRTKRSYGCGEKITCTSGSCRAYIPPPPPPPPTYPPPQAKDGGGNGHGGKKGGGGNDGGDGGQGGSSSSAGGPN
jgi:uncharacterized membrane protein YgcG